MSAQYISDMTKGSEIRHLIVFSFPMLIGNVFQQFYNMVDSAIVGNYVGENSLAAVGATGSLVFLFFSLCNGMSLGVGILISQYFGAKDEKNVKSTIINAVYLIGITGIIMSILGVLFTEPVLILMKTPEKIIEESIIYMKIVCGGTIAVAAYNAISAMLRALGDSKTPLIFLIVASVINVGLDFLFVLAFDLGVMGVACATVISQAISAIGSILFAIFKNPYFKIEKKYRKVNSKIIKKCIKIGVPVAAQNSLIALSCVVLQRVVNQFGEIVVAAFTATNRIEQLVQQPYNSLGAAVSTFTGQNIGSRNLERVKKGYYKSILLVALFSIIMLLAAQFGGRLIMQLFVKKEEVISLGAKALRITSYFYFALGMIYITRGLLNGVGDAIYSMINGIMEIIGRVGFSSTLVKISAIGVWGIWYTTGLTWLITGAASIIRYRQGKWKTKNLVKEKNN